MMSAPRFTLGRVVATVGALQVIEQLEEFPYLRRHESGDWGDLSLEDKRENELSVERGYRVFSAYDTPAGRVWIITEADRSSTTVLLPEDY